MTQDDPSEVSEQASPGGRVRTASRATSRQVLTLLAFALLVVVQAVCLVRQQNPMHEDDALFFFRYADNLAAGHGFRWNPEEPPVWGASAPLWPLLLASGEVFGLTAAQASLAWSWVLALTATLTLGLVVQRQFGPLAVMALAPLLAIQHLYSTWCTSGMESPLTFALIALALLAASGRGKALFLGTVAGLCLVHKLDLAPLGGALLAGAFVWRREHARRATLVALGIALAWYAFATWHFGSPLPNSFLSKLRVDLVRLPHSWFARVALLMGAGGLRTALACLGLIALRKQRFLAAIALTQVLVPTLAYTLRPPAEGFMWYAAATAPALAFLATCGLAFLLRADARREPRPIQVGLTCTVLVLLGWVLERAEYPRVVAWHEYLETYQGPMLRAGRWVNWNTPPETRVLTNWGIPAYYSRRFVYDGSGLNRRPEKDNLFLKYEPEVWIQCKFGRLADFTPHAPYRVVKVFTTPQEDYFAAVLFYTEPPPRSNPDESERTSPRRKQRKKH